MFTDTVSLQAGLDTVSMTPKKGVTVLVPNGSMREKMLQFLRDRGFVPLDEGAVAFVCKEKYAEGDLGAWVNAQGDSILVRICDRRTLPGFVKDREDKGELAIAMTCSDIVLNTWLELSASGRDVGENSSDLFRTYPLPLTSGRNGGNARWAMLVPKEGVEGKSIYPGGSDITALSELPLLALELAERAGSDTEERVRAIFEVQGSEEQRLLDANASGLDTVAICVVESGRSAEEAGLVVVELFRVETRLVISERLARQDPVRVREIERMFGLREARPVRRPNFEKRGGLVTVIMQQIDEDGEPGKVLMSAFVNEEAYRRTIETGIATFWSTSRNKLWVKGEDSGNYFIVRDILFDCDRDSLIYLVEPATPDAVACHTGERTCFYRSAVMDVLETDESDSIRYVSTNIAVQISPPSSTSS